MGKFEFPREAKTPFELSAPDEFENETEATSRGKKCASSIETPGNRIPFSTPLVPFFVTVNDTGVELNVDFDDEDDDIKRCI